MQTHLLRRILYGLLALFGVSVITFAVMRILPGDPLVAMFGMEGFVKLSAADRARILDDLGLSDPLVVQYGRWMHDIVRGRLGKSFLRGESVAEIIMHRGPLSAQIGLMSVVVSWIVGLPVGILSAFRPNSVMDHMARCLSILFLAIPGFWLGMLIVLALLFLFQYKAPLLVAHLWQGPWANLQLVIGPAIVLGLGQGAYIARMSRSHLLEVIREDYVRTAQAKGLAERLVVIRHALPNALLPVITLSGILMGFVPGGLGSDRTGLRGPGPGANACHRGDRA
jgi:peptide/nickel transport system permease protein